MEDNGILVVMMDIDPAKEDEFQRWYNEDHIPERMEVEGFLRARRYVAIEDGKPKYLAIYEVSDPAVFSKPEYTRLRGEGKSKWTEALEPFQSNMQRIAFKKIFDTKA